MTITDVHDCPGGQGDGVMCRLMPTCCRRGRCTLNLTANLQVRYVISRLERALKYNGMGVQCKHKTAHDVLAVAGAGK